MVWANKANSKKKGKKEKKGGKETRRVFIHSWLVSLFVCCLSLKVPVFKPLSFFSSHHFLLLLIQLLSSDDIRMLLFCQLLLQS